MSELRPSSKQIADLERKMRATKSSRFNAAIRIKNEHRSTVLFVSILSVYITTFSIIPIIAPGIFGDTQKIANVFTVGASIGILVIMVVQEGRQKSVDAELLRRSAHEILELFTELRTKNEYIGMEEFSSISAKYTQSLSRYNIDHDDVDFYKYILDNKKSFGSGAGWNIKVYFLIIPYVFWRSYHPGLAVFFLFASTIWVLWRVI